MRRSNPHWLADRLKTVVRTGRLDLSGEVLDDLSLLGSRAAMKHLSLAFTQIRKLSGLLVQPNLESLNLDSSDLQNFRAVANLSSVSLKDSPASRLPHFKLSLVIVLGTSLIVAHN
jgi:hypothetical protein